MMLISRCNSWGAGRDLRPGMSEKEVELLLFDEGFLSDRRVWNACEELELQVRDRIACITTLHSNAQLQF